MPLKNKPNIETITKSALSKGLRLCADNARRLLDSSKILLDSGCVNHAYIFWALAIEEYGKLLLLKEKGTATSDGIVALDIADLFGGRKAHKLKFNRGLQELGVSEIIQKSVRVLWNTSEKGKVIDFNKNQVSGNRQIFVTGFTTGLFEDVSSTDDFGDQINYKLREEFIYVDLQNGKFLSPHVALGVIDNHGIGGHFELSHTMLHAWLQSLEEKINGEQERVDLF